MKPVSRFARPSFAAVATSLLACASAVLTACSDDITPPGPSAPRGAVVLDGFIQPGLTLVGDTGTVTSYLALGTSTDFDAGGFTIARDTVLAVSSRGAGDLLYVTDLNTRNVRKIQMPARSNPGKARLLTGTGGATLIAVALRDSSSIALVSINGSTTTSTRIANAGTCPTDVIQYDNATWVFDANANCRVNYAVQGDARVIRIPNTGTARDTIALPGARASSVSAIVSGDFAYVATGGEANFSTSPFTLVASGAINKVDLRTRRVVATRAMPAGTYGGSTKLGLDGFLYVTVSENLVTFRSQTLKLRTDDLSFVGGATSAFLSLRTAAGADVACSGAQADALGRVHCFINGSGSATSLLVFNTAGVEIRRVPAGQGGVDLALR